MEYFGQKLDGFEFTTAGWVQSYGSRYVRPPIIYDDVSRPSAMTVKEFEYAQSLTKKPVKGMLTGELESVCCNTKLCQRLPASDMAVDFDSVRTLSCRPGTSARVYVHVPLSNL